ncbi:MAG: NUDIX domain-containing protein [Candidatus Saccharimonadales bacterium]
MSEFIDVLDERGLKTGEVLPIDEVHRKGLWHGVAHLCVYNTDGQVLLQLRHQSRSWGANQWDLAGAGHISAMETPVDGAIRETQEEIGLSIRADNLTLIGVTKAVDTIPANGLTHKVHEWNYITEKDVEPSKLELQDGETMEVKWFSIDKVRQDLNDPEALKKYAPRSKYLYMLFIDALHERLKHG